MILAVMPRVTLGHTGRELTANRATVAIFVLINAAAIVRVCASWHTEFMTILLLVAGACWIAAFGLFELVYGPMLLTRQTDRASGVHEQASSAAGSAMAGRGYFHGRAFDLADRAIHRFAAHLWH